MAKKLTMLVLSLLVVGCMAFAAGAEKSFTGTVSDSHCGAKHSTPSKMAEECVEKCASMGAKYVLVSHGKVYKLDGQDKFKGLGGELVHVKGTLSGDTITVSSVSKAEGMRHKKSKA
jgi:hypothetical protein